MANYPLKNDNIDTIPIVAKDAAGDTVAMPANITPTIASNGDPAALNAVINGSSLVINALVDAATNISIEIDDGTLTPFTLVIDIVEDVDPTAVFLDIANVTHTTQPRPPAATPPGTPAPTDTPAPVAPTP